MTMLVAAVAGAAIGLGVLIAVGALTGRLGKLRSPMTGWRPTRRHVAATVSVVVVWVVTGWP